MAITSGDLATRFSGGAANTNKDASLGGAMSTVGGGIWTGGTLHDLFDIVTGDENAASESEYRCVYLQNNHGSLTYQNVKFWVSAEQAGGATFAIALGAATDAAASATPTAVGPVANENTAPSGPTFSTPTDKASGLDIGDIGAGFAFPVWFRRTTANSAALDNDSATVSFEGDTAA